MCLLSSVEFHAEQMKQIRTRTEEFGLRNRLRGFVPTIIASIWQSFNKFYVQSVFEIF